MTASPELLARPREVLAAAPDVARRALGLPVAHMHPLAENLSLADVALVCGRNARPQAPHELDRAVQARGMGTSDFTRLLSDAARGLVEQRYALAADHLSFATPVDAPDFRAFALPAVDTEALDPAPLNELGNLEHSRIVTPAGAATATLGSFGRVVTVSRQAIVDGALAALNATMAGAAVAAARLEARLVADALENPATLDDQALPFHADFGNLVALALDATSLGTAMGALRTQKTAAGTPAETAARHLIVEPALEYAARKLLFDAGLSTLVSVHVLATLPTGRWYLLGDPSLVPVVSTLRLAGARAPVAIEPVRKVPGNLDGAGLRLRVDAGAAMLGRVGIVRGGV